MRVCDNDREPGDVTTFELGQKEVELCKVCYTSLLAFDWSALAQRSVGAAQPEPKRTRKQRTSKPKGGTLTVVHSSDETHGVDAAGDVPLSSPWETAAEGVDEE